MSIDMYLGQARSQANSVKSVCNQLSQGYSSLLQSNQQFIGTGELSSKAYDSAKAFFSAVIQPLVQGAEVGAEMTAEACQKFVNQYTSEVDSIDLKSDQLERRIQQVNQSIQHIRYINNNLPSLPLGNNPLKQINQRIIESLETTKRDLEKKLEKLLAFNASSPAIFSEVNAFYSTLAQGLQQANTSFNPSTGTFTVPKGKALDWTKNVRTNYDKREVDRISKLFPNKVKPQDLATLADIQKRNPEKSFPKELQDKLKQAFGKYADDISEIIGKYGEDALSISSDTFFETIDGYVDFDTLGKYLTKGGSALSAFGVANMSGASSYAAGQMVKNVGLPVAGFAIGMLDDTSKGQSLGQAIAHNGAVAGTATWLTVGGTILLGSNPAGWAVAGTAVIAGFIANKMYDNNIMGIKDMSDDWANNFDQGLEKISKGADKVGQSISKGFGDLISGFGW